MVVLNVLMKGILIKLFFYVFYFLKFIFFDIYVMFEKGNFVWCNFFVYIDCYSIGSIFWNRVFDLVLKNF